jgi:hypothetical protein
VGHEQHEDLEGAWQEHHEDLEGAWQEHHEDLEGLRQEHHNDFADDEGGESDKSVIGSASRHN